jgi:hypothetical protein
MGEGKMAGRYHAAVLSASDVEDPPAAPTSSRTGSPTITVKEAVMSAASIARAPVAVRRPLLAGTLAVLAAVVANAVAATLTDLLFHALDVYPAWGQPMNEPGDNLLAYGYRTLYGVLGGWLAARLAPHAPMRHAIAYGVVGLVLSSIAAAVAITQFDLGPDWYPLLLAATALPSAWAGGMLHRRTQARAARR